MERRFQWVIAGFLLLILSAVLAAQMKVDVRLVNVVATVTDERGRYVGGLTVDDFIVEEDGVPQKVVHFSQDHEIPVSVGIVLDTSGSMDRKIRTAVDAVDRFVRRIHPEDEIFLMTFSSSPSMRQDFTSDRDKLSNALERIRVVGGTALYDALSQALDRIRSGRHTKRAILLISDGQDTSSDRKLEDVLQSIRESELLVYSLGISPLTYAQRTDHVPFSWPLPSAVAGRRAPVSSKRDEVDMRILHDFGENSGGRAFLLSESWIGGRGTEIEKVLDQVADELRSQYTLGYYPPRGDDGKYHGIRIHTKNGHIVRARRGYLAGGSSQ
jgi:Ca-activated chloride channel family protein